MKLEEFTYVDAKILSITEVKIMKSEEIKQPLLKSFLRKKQGEEANSYVEVNAAFVEIKIELLARITRRAPWDWGNSVPPPR